MKSRAVEPIRRGRIYRRRHKYRKIIVQGLKRWWPHLIAALVLIAIACYTPTIYRKARLKRLTHKAQELLERKDYGSAAIFAHRVLEVDLRHVEAARIMAQATEATGSTIALAWWRQVSAIEPQKLQNQLDWASAALRFDDPALAEQALETTSKSNRKTAAYNDMAAQVKIATGDLAGAETNALEAFRLEPKNEKYELGLVAIRLRSDDPAIRNAARSRAEQLAEKAGLKRRALQALLDDAVARKETDTAIDLARRLQEDADAPFQARLQYLTLLQEAKHPQFPRYLGWLQSKVIVNPHGTAALIGWMSTHHLALVAIDWSKQLPAELRAQLPVPQAIAGAYAQLGDWKVVKSLITNQYWEHLEFMRLAFLARVLREEGDELGWPVQWTAALKAAADKPEAVAALARVVNEWGWNAESVELLWQVAKAPAGQQWALNALFRHFLERRSTRNLLKVATRALEIDPTDRIAQNNFAAFSLLLNTDMKRATAMAKACYEAEARNPAYASTYAFALHQQGQTEEGLELMKALDKAELGKPQVAAYYGAMLAASGPADEAARYLDIAERGRILPEEEALVAQARQQLANRKR